MTPMHFLPDQRFDCSGCARCCRSPWQVAVDEPSRRRIQELPLAQEGLVRRPEGTWVTARREGACVFLSTQARCTVHEQLGEGAKPHTCRQFPFLYQDTPAGLYVGVSLYCSAAQRNQGRPLEVHAEQIRQLVKEAPAPSRSGPLRLTEESWVEWDGYLVLEQALADRPRLTRALLLLAGGPAGLVSPAELGARLADPLPAPDPMLAWMETSFVAGLLARLEGCSLEELLADRPVLAGSLAPSRVQEAMRIGSPGWLNQGLERYREALLFRKFLLSGERALLENLLVLHLALVVVEVASWAQALAAARESPVEEDFLHALGRCELDLLTHGGEAFAMSGSFWKFFRERVRAGPG